MRPFQNEEELEKFVYAHPELIGDVFMISRQVRGGGKAGIPDIIGLNADDDVCVIEIKNVRVDSTILSQVLEYAIWAERNPDSIKNMWLECKHQPEDRTPSFENYSVRVIVIAPSIDISVLQHVGKVNIPIDLFEVNRYHIETVEIIVVHKLEPTSSPRAKPAQGLGEYDRLFYESHHDKTAVDSFYRYLSEIETIIKRESWPLELKFNKQYATFKNGNSQAFAIAWYSTKTFGFFFKLSEAEARAHNSERVRLHRYDRSFKEAHYRIEPGKSVTEDFVPLMRACVAKLVG